MKGRDLKIGDVYGHRVDTVTWFRKTSYRSSLSSSGFDCDEVNPKTGAILSTGYYSSYESDVYLYESDETEVGEEVVFKRVTDHEDIEFEVNRVIAGFLADGYEFVSLHPVDYVTIDLVFKK